MITDNKSRIGYKSQVIFYRLLAIDDLWNIDRKPCIDLVGEHIILLFIMGGFQGDLFAQTCSKLQFRAPKNWTTRFRRLVHISIWLNKVKFKANVYEVNICTTTYKI